MKVIFLDIDGVLVTLESFQRYKKSGASAQASPPCVEQLNRITRQTGAKIVLSSTWRMFGHRYMDLKFEEWGVEEPIRDFTPDLTRQQQGGVVDEAVPRGREIQAWFTQNDGLPERFVILDDDADMEHLAPWLVRTQFMDGLTSELADDAIRILNTSPKA